MIAKLDLHILMKMDSDCLHDQTEFQFTLDSSVFVVHKLLLTVW